MYITRNRNGDIRVRVELLSQELGVRTKKKSGTARVL